LGKRKNRNVPEREKITKREQTSQREEEEKENGVMDRKTMCLKGGSRYQSKHQKGWRAKNLKKNEENREYKARKGDDNREGGTSFKTKFFGTDRPKETDWNGAERGDENIYCWKRKNSQKIGGHSRATQKPNNRSFKTSVAVTRRGVGGGQRGRADEGKLVTFLPIQQRPGGYVLVSKRHFKR